VITAFFNKGLTENQRNIWVWESYPQTLSAWSIGATVAAQPKMDYIKIIKERSFTEENWYTIKIIV